MKLDIFNPWRDLVSWAGYNLQYQTSKKGESFVTYVRDKKSQKPITYGLSRTSKDEAVQRAIQNIKRIGGDGISQALSTGQMVRPSENVNAPEKEPRRDIDWRDGANHRYRAQRDIVDRERKVA